MDTSPCPKFLYQNHEYKSSIILINLQSLINSKMSMSHLVSSTKPSSILGFYLWSVRLLCGTVQIATVSCFTEYMLWNKCHKNYKVQNKVYYNFEPKQILCYCENLVRPYILVMLLSSSKSQITPKIQ